MDEQTPPQKNTLDLSVTLLGFGGMIGILVFISTFISGKLRTSLGNDYPFALGTGEFGDSFGFATSLFTGLAFIGLLIAVRLQRTELSLLKDERIETKKILDSQISEAHKTRTARERTERINQIFSVIGEVKKINIETTKAIEGEKGILRKKFNIYQETATKTDAVEAHRKQVVSRERPIAMHLYDLDVTRCKLDELIREVSVLHDFEKVKDNAFRTNRVFAMTSSTEKVESACGYKLAILALNLINDLWDNSAQEDRDYDFNQAFVEMIKQSMDSRYHMIFEFKILREAFLKGDVDTNLLNIIPEAERLFIKTCIQEIQYHTKSKKFSAFRNKFLDL